LRHKQKTRDEVQVRHAYLTDTERKLEARDTLRTLTGANLKASVQRQKTRNAGQPILHTTPQSARRQLIRSRGFSRSARQI
jgi:hypothetical protein